ncbi:(NiFe) hydrogenase maturation protein HypF [Methanothermus fervidus DSM 2088]|uniref:Carbamoyltransferase n=1 Tax=Methanothermus fervidus (strain ATCC 43054 / DSM 2088 / JCM 10308 / V24 S) TaxID=523846 RepID=E3GWU7_METFV|nr:carbamoyltransferase HypF [Methanothermus fervidus]ADP78016.1 (NiFe) hydrogenase maturation protein HypF [Methanothermus fervidus DSM 2088]
MQHAQIIVEGIVQGVGFRPTIYRLAKHHKLKGYVKNLGNVVEIVVAGKKSNIKNFLKSIEEEKPPLCKIFNIDVKYYDAPLKFDDFKIVKSSKKFYGSSIIPADIATCKDCLEEIDNPKDRRYNYPFTSCTNCGPRFTIIKSLPYDRERTSMDEFPLCDKCLKEYEDPEDRRYHAETTCCPTCGPKVFLWGLDVDDPIKETAKLLDEGYIVAIKGIGGAHIACDATDEDVVKKLRKRLNRPSQPFACMSKDIDTIKKFAIVNENEKETLLSKSRPIVVLKKKEDCAIANSVSPGLHTIGVMLPYSGLHHILFKYLKKEAYVMTSANKPGMPMLIKNRDIIKKLNGIADYFLLHDRKIINRCDDSVIRFRGGKKAFLRRSRGYAPEPYDFSKYCENKNILALGPELDVTFALVKNGKCYVSQHIGNVNNYDVLKFLKSAINRFLSMIKIDSLDVVACDLHPQFLTTKLAQELSQKYSCKLLKVQHHHAHAASLAFDANVDEYICITADGVGYGSDGTVWGGEILHFKGKNFKRMASLIPQKMPGGDLCTYYPARMLLSILKNVYDDEELVDIMDDYKKYFPHGKKEIEIVIKQLNKDFNVNITTSTGRILDSIAVALHICSRRTYEGECAMKLESAAYYGNDGLEITKEIYKTDNRYVLDTSLMLRDVIELLKKGEKRRDIAFAAQKALAEGLAELSVLSAEKAKVDIIGGSGGVFINEAITKTVKEYVENQGYKFVQHENSCPGDGSISLGQAFISCL